MTASLCTGSTNDPEMAVFNATTANPTAPTCMGYNDVRTQGGNWQQQAWWGA